MMMQGGANSHVNSRYTTSKHIHCWRLVDVYKLTSFMRAGKNYFWGDLKSLFVIYLIKSIKNNDMNLYLEL
ncbi:MAG TPA: hypothetical protein DCS87_02070 [Rheinheimera sp.]|nr:hypothetical protein [Rheinheimera sp.]